LIPEKYKTSEYTWIEPACGTGAFYNEFPSLVKKVALDLDPKMPGTIKQDFFDYTANDSKIVVVTNPPFGKVYKLAVDFFNHAATFADTICMLIPTSFEGYAIHRRLNPNFKLTKTVWTREDAFLHDGKDYPLRCCFQIWERSSNSENLRLNTFEPKLLHKDFELIADGSQQKVRKTAHLQNNYDIAVPWWDCKRLTLDFSEAKKMPVCTTRWLLKCKDEKVIAKIKSLNLIDCASAGQSGAPLMKWNHFVKLYDGAIFNRI